MMLDREAREKMKSGAYIWRTPEQRIEDERHVRQERIMNIICLMCCALILVGLFMAIPPERYFEAILLLMVAISFCLVLICASIK